MNAVEVRPVNRLDHANEAPYSSRAPSAVFSGELDAWQQPRRSYEGWLLHRGCQAVLADCDAASGKLAIGVLRR
jgi:hypothetical protein